MIKLTRRLAFAAEIIILSSLILVTRCANYQDVFVGGHIYFTDADCYARMTRVRLCAQHPGLILRHHSFENFPQGTTPHTTAPLDYAILTLSFLLRPLTSRPIDLAGALISPLFALVGAIFLCWWSRYIKLRFRWTMLILFGLSPILVHGTSLGRPDHQSLALLLVIVAICADWTRQNSDAIRWSIVSGLAWGMAIWVSAYEPLILFVLVTLTTFVVRLMMEQRDTNYLKERLLKIFTAQPNRLRWIILAATLAIALMVERRIPSFSLLVRNPLAHNWARTVGELTPIPLISTVWLRWVGLMILAVPFLVALSVRRRQNDFSLWLVTLLSAVTFCLTMWQARWGYYFAVTFILGLPVWLGTIQSPLLVWAFVGSLWPVLRDWDQRIWPSDLMASRQIEQRHEAVELRELSFNLISGERHAFLAPWWLSPAIAYWSGQPAVAGSSHESLSGIVDSAEFYLAENPASGAQFLRKRAVDWVIGYDSERVMQNSAAVLGKAASGRCLARVLDQRPTQSPEFLF